KVVCNSYSSKISGITIWHLDLFVIPHSGLSYEGHIFQTNHRRLAADRSVCLCCVSSGGVYLSKIIQSKARLFTRNIRDPGTSFEYVIFFRQDKFKCACIFQAGHLLEGAPGPIPLGSTVLIESILDKEDGRKIYISCRVTSTDGSKLHTEATVMISWLMSSCHNKDILNNVNFVLKVS
uniref:Uncharacterized protein n=1 Tax=Poecilia latipinna TaxID=48699 RepID=A0A3B3TPV8_9TELE